MIKKRQTAQRSPFGNTVVRVAWCVAFLLPLACEMIDKTVDDMGTDDTGTDDTETDRGDCEPAYTIGRVATPIEIDGVLTEFEGVEALDTSIEGGNTLVVRALWDDDALYLSFRVTDTDLLADVKDRDGDIWLDDAVEWYVDSLGNGGGGGNPDYQYMLPDDFQGIVSASNVQRDARGTDEGESDVAWDGDWRSAVELTGTLDDSADIDTEFTVEIRIPWTTLDLDHPPDPGSCMRMGFAMDDKDSDAFDTIMWPDYTTGFRNASKWQEMLLSGR